MDLLGREQQHKGDWNVEVRELERKAEKSRVFQYHGQGLSTNAQGKESQPPGTHLPERKQTAIEPQV